MLRLYPASASWITQFCPTRPPLRSEHFGGAAEAGTAVTTLEKPTKTAAVAARTDVGMRIDGSSSTESGTVAADATIYRRQQTGPQRKRVRVRIAARHERGPEGA